MFNTERRDSLPMYKDKPFGYSGSSRRSAWRKKRTVGLVLGSLAGLSWYFGILSPLSYFAGESEGRSSSSSSWSLFGTSKSNVDWDARAQSVREAFQLSWAGYEKFAWGMFWACCISELDEVLTGRSKDMTNSTQKRRLVNK